MTSLSGLSVLLVEDEFIIAIDAEDMLREMGAASVDVVGRFDEAEEKIQEKRFDLAILDVNLNGKTSFSLADMLLKRGTAVLYYTGYNLHSRPIAGFAGGICVSKPYTAKSLRDGVEAALADFAISSSRQRDDCSAPLDS